MAFAEHGVCQVLKSGILVGYIPRMYLITYMELQNL